MNFVYPKGTKVDVKCIRVPSGRGSYFTYHNIEGEIYCYAGRCVYWIKPNCPSFGKRKGWATLNEIRIKGDV